MDASIWASLILVGGGILLALGALFAVKTAARWPELQARAAQNKVVAEAAFAKAEEAYELARQARRLATPRRRRKREELEDATAPPANGKPPPAFGPRPFRPGWFPGCEEGAPPPADASPEIVGFADEDA